MGTITPALWEVLEFEHDNGDGLRIGLDDYPIHDPGHRLVLNRLIIDEYLNREIGLESVPLFMHRLRLKMRQIMPYYNKLYATEDLLLGKELATFDLTTTRDDTTSENANDKAHNESSENGTNTGHTATGANAGTLVNSTAGSRNVNSDTPEVQLSGDEDYATTLNDANSTGMTNTASNQNTTSDSNGGSTANGQADSTLERTVAGRLEALSRTTGFQGAASDLLTKYRATLLNIDYTITRELGDLFLLIRGNSAEHFPYPLHRNEFGALLP